MAADDALVQQMDAAVRDALKSLEVDAETIRLFVQYMPIHRFFFFFFLRDVHQPKQRGSNTHLGSFLFAFFSTLCRIFL